MVDEGKYIEVNHPGFLMIENVILDRIMPVLPTSAQVIYIRIFRQTLGFRDKRGAPKLWDTIAHSQFRRWCHIKSTNTVKSALELLSGLELIESKPMGKGKASKYKINAGEINNYRDDEYEHPLYQKLI